jgi:hypothetical protein
MFERFLLGKQQPVSVSPSPNVPHPPIVQQRSHDEDHVRVIRRALLRRAAGPFVDGAAERQYP